MSNQTEFDRQVTNLLEKKYPEMAGINQDTFLELLVPLRSHVDTLTTLVEDSSIPFVLIVTEKLLSSEQIMSQISINGKNGVINMFPCQPSDFSPLPELSLPNQAIYLLLDISTGREYLNVPPKQALESILAAHRTPLTIAEGLALLTHFPEILTDSTHYNAFQLLGSRRADKKIPSIWMSYKQPRLGWCWDGNPHSWLGAASAAMRKAN